MTSHPSVKKIELTVRRISLLMQHQMILPDLKEITLETLLIETNGKEINYDSPEFLMGAQSALLALLSSLEQKGPPNQE